MLVTLRARAAGREWTACERRPDCIAAARERGNGSQQKRIFRVPSETYVYAACQAHARRAGGWSTGRPAPLGVRRPACVMHADRDVFRAPYGRTDLVFLPAFVYLKTADTCRWMVIPAAGNMLGAEWGSFRCSDVGARQAAANCRELGRPFGTKASGQV